MNRPLARRDFVLDTGAVLHFATDLRAFEGWWQYLHRSYENPSVLVPGPVLTECTTGSPRTDALVNHLFALIDRRNAAEQHILTPSTLTFARAGVLRTLATATRPAHAKHVISAIDAMVVALAEERAEFAPVVVTTSDPGDIQLLVDLTEARNIGVWPI